VVQPVTLKDISIRAGVSTFTVSQALGGKPGVSEVTRHRITQVANELGYVPNALAAGLKGQRSRSVGVMTASGRNQYYSMLVQAIDGVLQEAGYHAVTNDAMRGGRYSEEREGDSVDELLQQRVAAIVATYSLSESSVRKIERWGIPVVFVDSLPPSHTPGAPFIGADNYRASEKVATYFASLGFTSAAFLAFPKDWNTRAPREAGFVETATASGIATSVVESENSAESASSAMSAFLAEHAGDLPDALYASNTVLLQGALRAIRSAGLEVPRDISIVGFDDFEWAELVSPPITVVDQHVGRIGELAARTLLDLINSGSISTRPIHAEVQPNLIIRESCAPRS
jgi:LacI family transcriptional regulator